jgi:uncharacterized protein (TIGR04222 family)
MNLKDHQLLWANIQQFAFDEPNAVITFSKKLADQQKWPAEYTQRVIEEYRRFIFLCCISPKGASPSKAVDEAWHLHLTYTRSYWEAFCKNTLGKDIHHHPSNGGDKEDHKHSNWYNETLELYEEVFDEEPPADIWPQPVQQSEPVMDEYEGEVQYYLIRKELLILVILLLVLPFVINYILTGIGSPYLLTGAQFLWFYAMLCAAGIIAVYLLRRDRRKGMEKIIDAWPVGDLNIFQLTHSVNGKDWALQTCLVDLYRRNLISVNDNGKIVVHRNSYQAPEKEENPLTAEWRVKADGSTVNYKAIANKWYKRNLFEHTGIQKMLRLTFQNESRLQKYGVILIVLLIGLARVVQGWTNNRPVGLLFLEIIALLVGAGIIYYQYTTEGLVHYKLKQLLLDKAGSKQLHADEVVNDYALNGPKVLDWLPATLMLGSMFAVFPVPRRSDANNSGGDSSGSDSGISSCSGGTSCSGGSSCSGGGCGGCGGGGD